MLGIVADIKAALKNDPAARNWFEVLLTYHGVHALHNHRVAKFFHKIKFKTLARMISGWGRFITGIEIHPAANIEKGVFIDHGSGVVIGETAIVESGAIIYQGVTLGGKGHSVKGKRHPTVKSGAIIYAGAKIIGNITIGENAIIGAGSVVLKDVPPSCVAVGVPARIVKGNTPQNTQKQEKSSEEQA